MTGHPIQPAAILTAIVGLLGLSATEGGGVAAPDRAAVALGTGSSGAGPPSASARPVQTRYPGEYGLWVSLGPDSITVHWFTAERARGRLKVRADGRTLHRATTDQSQGHEVTFPRPETGRVTLRYGAATGEEMYETTVRLTEEDPVRGNLQGVDSLYVVGDVHGQYDRLDSLLRNAGLVDGDGHWSGGRKHLVLLGDLMDRGPDVRRLLWFVYRLQEEAARAGGRVHPLLGNHEVMVLAGDLRYVAPKEQLMARLQGVPYGKMYDPEASVLGRWITSWPVALRVNGVLLAHGGIGPAYRDWSVTALNDSARSWIREPLFRYWTDSTVDVPPMDSAAVARRVKLHFDGPSPLWYRGYARTDTLGETLRETLDRHDADLHVIAHTPVPEIRHSYRDSLILVDLRKPASEMLLLARTADGYERWALPVEGSARRIPSDRDSVPGGSP